MQSLPALVTASGEFDLPLSARTAETLVAALVACGSENCRDQIGRLLAARLEVDPALALWTVCRAAARGHAELRTVDSLAGWLAAAIREELTWAASFETGPPPEPWADLAARSYGIARLATAVARHQSLDAEQCHLLGLVHAAATWLTSAHRNNNLGAAPLQSGPLPRRAKSERSGAISLAGVMPSWLTAALEEIERADGQQVSSPATCVAAARSIADGKRGAMPRWPGFKFNRRVHTDEVMSLRQQWLEESALATALPMLSGKLARLDQLDEKFQRTLETEKLDSLKELAYGAGHEINNPLANISARAQTLLRDESDPERRRMLLAINTQAFRAHEMIADMMLFARPPKPHLVDVDLAAVLKAVFDELAPQAIAQQSELVFQVPAAPVIARADKTQISVAVRSLCANALEALVKGGRVELALGCSGSNGQPTANSPASCETVQITVSDNGPGIAPETRRHIFDPFYSGREAGRGLGFGLSKCWRIVSMHGGKIDVDSTPGKGATFTISLPAG